MNPSDPKPTPLELQNAVNSQQSDMFPAPAVAPCRRRCWIEIELLDDDDAPVPHEPYWVQLPDGAVRQGKLNDKGWIRLDQIPCGDCIVRFPRFPKPLAVPAREPAPPDRKGWIEIALVDADRLPVASEPFSITLPDGSVRQGTLNSQGRARIDGIPEGACRVSFPRIHASELISYSNG